MPPLGLLPLVAKGTVTPEMAENLKLTDKLRQDLDEMLTEHNAIVAALKELAAAARREDKPDYIVFVDKLIEHAHMKELVMYPTALLIGAYVRQKLGLQSGLSRSSARRTLTTNLLPTGLCNVHSSDGG